MRKKQAEKRITVPDPKFNDVIVTRFVNALMNDGKKNTARKILYQALDVIREKTGQDELEMFRKAINNAAPTLEVRSRRVGGATYQVPMEISEPRRIALAIRWLKQYSSARREKSMAYRLAGELMSAANGEGATIKKRDDVHRMAEANKAFAHFRW